MALNMTPTPPPVAEGSPSRTVFVNPEAKEFALFLPRRGQLVSESESEATSYCSNTADPSCAYQQPFPEGLIESVNFDSDPATEGPPAWIQATGCLKSDNGYVDPKDDGGQYDIRYPDGAQCTFGGYGASFIQLLEPGANRFCIRCCREANDQVNCNSHQDTQGCLTAIPGRYPAACAQ
ncbi:hypothetical protein C8J56DRAFT_1166652 [Mycena floridula]|nr:hypothetical protein C8J56DRAFT_1166652 [Mycena floridula]